MPDSLSWRIESIELFFVVVRRALNDIERDDLVYWFLGDGGLISYRRRYAVLQRRLLSTRQVLRGVRLRSFFYSLTLQCRLRGKAVHVSPSFKLIMP
jgi:hypothetical protein